MTVSLPRAKAFLTAGPGGAANEAADSGMLEGMGESESAGEAENKSFWRRRKADIIEPLPHDASPDGEMPGPGEPLSYPTPSPVVATDSPGGFDAPAADALVPEWVEAAQVQLDPGAGEGNASDSGSGEWVAPDPGPGEWVAPDPDAAAVNGVPRAQQSAIPGSFPPPVPSTAAPAFVPGQPLIDVDEFNSLGSKTGVGNAPGPMAAVAVPARPPVKGHRDQVPTGPGVPLGGWQVGPIVPEEVKDPARRWAAYLLVLTSTLVALATFLPWAEVASQGRIFQLNGWEDINGELSDGLIHIGAALIGVIAGGLALGARHGIWIRIVGAVGGLVALTTAALRAADYSTALGSLDGAPIDAIATMWGLWLLIAGAFIMTGAALLLER